MPSRGNEVLLNISHEERRGRCSTEVNWVVMDGIKWNQEKWGREANRYKFGTDWFDWQQWEQKEKINEKAQDSGNRADFKGSQI